MENKNFCCEKSQCQSQSQAGSLKNYLTSAEEQVELECFDISCRSLVKEICCIIAEVDYLAERCPLNEIKIGKENYTFALVSEVFHQLTHEHIEFVIEKFSKIKYEIKFRKSYLRTALYNSVFEMESFWANKYNSEN